jgi:hypothetical protein
MASSLQSPGVQVIEKDASAVTVGASTTTGGTVGVFQWGPVMSPILIDNENTLVSVFGKPDATTFGSFFSASNFLSYTNNLYVTRAATTNTNATAFGTGTLIKNFDDYETNFMSGAADVGAFAARYPGTLGNGIKVSYADSSTFAEWTYKDEFRSAPATSDYAAARGGSNDELHVIVIDVDGKFSGVAGGILEKFAYVSKGSDALSYTGQSNYYKNVIANQSSYIYWMDHPVSGWGVGVLNTAFPSIGIAATGGTWLSNVATITFAAMTVAPKVGSLVTVTGMTPSNYNGTYVVKTSSTTTVTYDLVGTAIGDGTGGKLGLSGGIFTGGTDDNAATDADLKLGWDLFKNTETYDISLFFTGNASDDLAKYVVDNIAETRKDCVVFASLVNSTGGVVYGTAATKLTDASTFKSTIGNSNYTVLDSGYKYMYDKYNDVYRWVALNADTAGLCAKVDKNQDTWFSPAGLTKGQIKGAIKLSWNPNQSERDALYKLAINPVVTFAGQGTLLYGDKTATLKPSAFDRINVRRLFLVLEKSISNSAKYQLFEQNDDITRQQFIASVEPFLRDIQGRRGISEFRVICDTTNNTPQVIQTNEFRGTILIRPVYSINFISLTFTAVGASVSFETAAQV